MAEKPIENISEAQIGLTETNRAPLLEHTSLLFNSREFIELVENRTVFSYKMGLPQEYPEISLSFDISENCAISLSGCPYAGIDLGRDIDNSDIKGFILQVVKKLSNVGIDQILIKEPPFFFQKKNLQTILYECGFSISSKDVNHHIDLGNDDYFESLHLMEKRKIKKCLKSGFIFKIEDFENLSRIYDFIKSCRRQQGLKINISQDQLKKAFQALPVNYNLFSIRNRENEIIAASVMVIVNKKVVYNYLPAFDRTFKPYSPLAFLTYELYGHFRSEGFGYIDMGISSINGKPQNGLISFKEKMGGARSSRNVYSLKF